MKTISLVKMKAGQKGRVLEVRGGANIHHRLMSMGIYQGKEIIKMAGFALMGPVAIKVNRRIFALGHGMASKVIVELE